MSRKPKNYVLIRVNLGDVVFEYEGPGKPRPGEAPKEHTVPELIKSIEDGLSLVKSMYEGQR